MSDRVNLVAAASPIERLPYLPNVWAIRYKLGQERLTRLGNSNLLWLPVSFFLSRDECASNVSLFEVKYLKLWFL